VDVDALHIINVSVGWSGVLINVVLLKRAKMYDNIFIVFWVHKFR